ncbi:Acyl-protein thioesterase 1 [Colletotrichum siamense]|uniref:Acyl-protein thioesterase 1 n=1 Tax=Colletotrichum siamense TaxID=690259 RepID=A0A9P5ESJ3_COLSI|nr:Acyl-protein thioesterase 1 [Colletotrichum siamense]KAF4858749.1 Acyl-protein thioesterase 1 [Colletotrichum siamense]
MRFTKHCIEPRAAHTHTVVFLHGRDSICNEFADELFESEASEPANQPRTLPDLLPSIRWVFPGAAVIPSKRFGTDMSQWFDVWSLENPEEQADIQKAGLRRSVEFLVNLIESESNLAPMEKIFLCGISQGFVTSVAALLSTSKLGSLGGLIGWCSWMPPAVVIEGLAEKRSPYHQKSVAQPSINPPIFLAHAVDDEVIDIRLGRQLRKALGSFCKTVEWHEYDSGGHWVNEPQGVDDMVSFLRLNMH